MIVRPPGLPMTATNLSRAMIAGVIDDNMRLPGRATLAAVPINPVVSVVPACR
jgi:hypothetical protein